MCEKDLIALISRSEKHTAVISPSARGARSRPNLSPFQELREGKERKSEGQDTKVKDETQTQLMPREGELVEAIVMKKKSRSNADPPETL